MVLSRSITAALTVCASFGLTACASVEPIAQDPRIQRIDLDTLPVPQEPFRLRPFDKLTISVFGQPDFNRELEISNEGQLSVPLIGTLQAAGLTPFELEKRIESQLQGQFIRNPSVSVMLNPEATRQIYVGGQVAKPGSFAFRGDITLQRAIVLSGGVNEFAKEDDVIVQREVDGQRYIGVYNITAIQRGNYPDPKLYPGDTVTVGDSPAKRQLLEILQIIPAVLQPLILVERVGVI